MSERQTPGTVSRTGSGAWEKRQNQVWGCAQDDTPPRRCSSKKAAISATWSIRGPGALDDGAACAQGPASMRVGALIAATVRKDVFRYPSAHPAMIIVGMLIRS